MKKWMFIVGFVLIVSLASVSVYAYQTIRDPLFLGYEQAEQYVVDQSLLTSISDIDYYHGTSAYFVIHGINQEGENSIIWVKEDLTLHHLENSADGITAEQALAIVEDEVNGCTCEINSTRF